MVSYIKTSVAAAATLLCMGAAQAGVIPYVIDFESPAFSGAPGTLVTHTDFFTQGDVWVNSLSNVAAAQAGDLVGAILDGSDASNCFLLTCPTNNLTTYYANLDDGLISLGMLNGLAFTIDRFDAAFMGDTTGLNTAVPGRIIFQGVNAATGAQSAFAFNLGANGQFSGFAPSAASALRNTAWSQMFIYGQTCSTAGACSAFNSNRGQFGLDNLRINVIPEPTSLALVAAAFVGLGVARRRRQA